MEKLAVIQKDLGIVLTPDQVVDFLVRWAIRSKEDTVIDPGAGKGAFILAAFDRLRELGALTHAASNQLYGAEYYEHNFQELTKAVREDTGVAFPYLYQTDLFDIQFPQVDAVIGNPPYVIRHRLKDSQDVRAKVALQVGESLRRKQTDLYSYFVMYAASFLKEGGRLAFIVSDSWLDMNFGSELKSFLLRNFKLQALISFDKRVFPDALVKTVILLAERNPKASADTLTHFIRIKRPVKLPEIEEYLTTEQGQDNGLKVNVVPQNTLDPNHYWGIYFKAPELYSQLSTHPGFTLLSNLAETRIGLQTLAKKFYILPTSTLQQQQLERQFFEPIAVSPREIALPVVDDTTPLQHFVLLCPETKAHLQGTNLLKYILAAEGSIVEVRTKNEQVQGYHNLTRLQKTGRQPWYNLKSETDRRGRYPILVPRRVYKNFLVIWNKARRIGNEDFIEVKPVRDEYLFPLLAVLSSSFAEFMIRSLGHIYGGGVCNLNPGDLKVLPIPNIAILDTASRQKLTNAYQEFVASEGQDQEILDKAIYNVLGDMIPKLEKLYCALDELRALSTGLKTL